MLLVVLTITGSVPLAAIVASAEETENFELSEIDDILSSIYDEIASDDSNLKPLFSTSINSNSFEFSSLTGRVVDEEGNGVSGVSVLIYNYDENTVLSLCQTDSDGLWSSVEYDVITGYSYI
ncbi:MAG: carboxypeptidase regulatory-like domain-containing protein, partial [Clostridia bacterium]|nr:carboxypeptidase regulatory-like domain-containing protein [Clostridia bacterium]